MNDQDFRFITAICLRMTSYEYDDKIMVLDLLVKHSSELRNLTWKDDREISNFHFCICTNQISLIRVFRKGVWNNAKEKDMTGQSLLQFRPTGISSEIRQTIQIIMGRDSISRETSATKSRVPYNIHDDKGNYLDYNDSQHKLHYCCNYYTRYRY